MFVFQICENYFQVPSYENNDKNSSFTQALTILDASKHAGGVREVDP